MHLTPRLLRRLAACALHDTPIAPACLLSHRPPPVSARSLPHRRTPISPPPPLPPSIRTAHSASSSRWQTRQARDPFTQSAKVAGLKSRAAYKLLQLQAKHRIFRRGATVVDLGYAPGSWAQVAMHAVGAGGRVVGVDLLPATPPRGVSTIQGNFLSAAVREGVREYVRDEGRGRVRAGFEGAVGEEEEVGVLGRMAEEEEGEREGEEEEGKEEEGGKKEGRAAKDAERGRVVDVVLSDMCEPWPQTTGSWINSVSNPYHRLMNTSGIPFRDHAGSMVCSAWRGGRQAVLADTDGRISVTRRWTLATTPCARAATSSANSTKEVRTSCWRSD